EEEDRQRRRHRRIEEFHENHPLAHFYCNKKDAPPVPEKYKLVSEWDAWEGMPDVTNRGGLVIVGNSGLGKTVSLYHLCERLAPDAHSVQIVNSEELNRIPKMAFDGSLDDYMEELKTVQYLALDDLDKVKMTQSVATAIWGLVESRLRGHGDNPMPLLI